MSKENIKKSKDLVFKTNFDLYPTSKDVDVSFYQELYKFKSVEDYLKSRKKKKKKNKLRKAAFLKICNNIDVNFLDFPTGTDGIPADSGISGANQIGGVADHVTIGNDEYGNDRYTSLNYATQNDFEPDNINLDEQIDQILNPKNDSQGAVPTGISNLEDEYQTNYDSSGYNGNSYVTTDVGTGVYSKIAKNSSPLGKGS